MKNKLLSLVVITVALIYSTGSGVCEEKKLNVVASSEFLADWARQIGNGLVDIEFIHDSRRDMHFFEPRPGHIIKCTRADVFITAGLDLDVWMQPLLDASRNPRIQYGTSGYIDASFGVHVLEKPPGRVDMSMGDIHPYGNPHYFHDMENVGIALENIVIGISRNDPKNEKDYRKNKEEYWQEVKTTFKTLKKLMEPYKGTKIVTYHKSWEYFAEEFGLEIVGNLEPKPGIPPSPRHLKELIQTIKQYEVKLIFKEPYYPERPAKKVSKQTGAKVLEMANFPGGRKEAPSYIENLMANVNDFLKAIEEVTNAY